jgi:hypothetical protein
MTEHGGFRYQAGLCGVNELHVGHDKSSFMFTDIATAVAAAPANATIVLHQGTHTLTSQVVINKPLRFIGIGGSAPGGCLVTCASTLTTSMFSIELVAQTAASDVYFQDIKFYQAVDNADIFDVNNTSIGYDLYLTFQNCAFYLYDTASTGKAIDIAHTTAAKAIVLTVGSCKGDVIGCVNATVANAGDKIKLIGMECVADGNASAVITSNTNIAAGIEFRNCLLVATKGSSGGHATQTVKSYYSFTASDYAVTTDFAGSHTETIIGEEDTDT